MMRTLKLTVIVGMALAANTLGAAADSCSGHSHDTGTALGAVGGGLIGGLASHSIVGGVAGAVVGGVAGNAIARSDDCHHHTRVRRESYYIDRDGHRHYYTR